MPMKWYNDAFQHFWSLKNQLLVSIYLHYKENRNRERHEDE